MSYSSCIRHPEQNRYIQIYEWQVQFCQQNHCAALLIAFFSSWHDWKLKNDQYYCKANDIAECHGDGRPYQQDAYLFFSMEELIEGCMGFYGKNSINAAIDFLVSLKVISIHQNPNPRYHFDKTRYFKIYPEVCNNWLLHYEKNKHNVSNDDQNDDRSNDRKYDVKNNQNENVKSNIVSQNVIIDEPISTNREHKMGRRLAKKGRLSIKKGKAITYTTNNTTNKENKENKENKKNKFIQEIEVVYFENETDLFDLSKNNHPTNQDEEEVLLFSTKEVFNALVMKGFQAHQLKYPEVFKGIYYRLKEGATVEFFIEAYDISQKTTKTKGFNIQYLFKVVDSLLIKATSSSLQSPLENQSDNYVYQSDIKNAASWANDILDKESEL